MFSIIGPYRIEREIARGGMGIVYLAHDTRLDRTVALKALPAEVASNPERLDRFEREAKLLASLNHPNIGAIHDVVESDGRRYLALEHIQGETLAQRLSSGALPVDEALEICLQIATGMEAAHESGVIHRDLKPGNVMITPGDRVKIVDFGLARGTLTRESGLVDSPTVPASSPTITSPAYSPGTIPGVILGTAPYLSPEQARGKPVDRRTDIWSWGCILYECLTGRMAFQGETVSDTIAAILKQEPDWLVLPRETPTPIRDLIHRCLEKDPRRRLRDIGEASIAIERALSDLSVPATPSLPLATSRRARLVLAILLGCVLTSLVWVLAGRLSPPQRGGHAGPIHVSVPIPPDLEFDGARLMHDGSAIVLRTPRRTPGAVEDTRPRLYLRRLDQMTFEPVPGTEATQYFLMSPDSRWLGFVVPIPDQPARFRLLKVPLDRSAPPIQVVDIDPKWGAPAWLENGDLLYSVPDAGQYVRIPPGKTSPSDSAALTIPRYHGELGLDNGTNLPRSRAAFVIGSTYERGSYSQDIGVLDFKSGKAKILIQDGGSPQYSPTGHLLFARGSTLLAAPFDVKRLKLTGEPIPIMGDLWIRPDALHAYFILARDGTLFYIRGGGASRGRHAVIIDRNGVATEWSGERRSFVINIAVSPDGNRFAAVVRREDGIDEIWVSERGKASRRIVAAPGADCHGTVWSPDGSQIAYQQYGRSAADGLYAARVAGGSPPRRLCGFRSAGERILPLSWSPDGSTILARRVFRDRLELVTLDANSSSSTPRLLPLDPPIFDARFSPDGGAIAYITGETGRSAAIIRSYAKDGTLGEPIQASTAGARDVTWSYDGRQLLFMSPQRKLMAVNVQSAPRLSVSPAFVRFDVDSLRFARPLALGRGLFDLLPDGRLLAIQKGEGEDEIHRLELTLNFFDELRTKAGQRRQAR